MSYVDTDEQKEIRGALSAFYKQLSKGDVQEDTVRTLLATTGVSKISDLAMRVKTRGNRLMSIRCTYPDGDATIMPRRNKYAHTGSLVKMLADFGFRMR